MRKIYLSNYKNLGIEKSVDFLIDNCRNGEEGGLIVILGENNVGKSNVLSALKDIGECIKGGEVSLAKSAPNFLEYKEKPIELKLTTTLPYKPLYEIVIQNNALEAGVEYYHLEGKEAYLAKLQAFLDNEKELFAVYGVNSSSDAREVIRIFCPSEKKIFLCAIKSSEGRFNCFSVVNFDENTQSQLKTAFRLPYTLKVTLENIPPNPQAHDAQELIDALRQKTLPPQLESKTHVLILSSTTTQKDPLVQDLLILPYKPTKVLKSEDLTSQIEDLENSPFFTSLFNALELPIETLQKAYKEDAQKKDTFLHSLEKKYNKEIQTSIAKKFNDLYSNNGANPYIFSLLLKDNRISFVMEREDTPIFLNEQSSGFVWFFNFFFNFLYNSHLKRGDIVLIDEVETHLSIPAQREIRDFLQKFGKEQGLTFIVTTHSPYCVDIRELGNVRLLRHKENKQGAEVINDISLLNCASNNALESIFKALNVDYFTLIAPQDRLIFVEGISDCCYLNAFSELEREKGKALPLIFIPIGGVGEMGGEEYCKELEGTLKQVSYLSKIPPLLLVDSDKPGLSAQGHIKNLEVKDLKSILGDSKITTIEDCFCEADRAKLHGLHKKEARVFSLDNTKACEFSTKDNFSKLLNACIYKSEKSEA